MSPCWQRASKQVLSLVCWTKEHNPTAGNCTAVLSSQFLYELDRYLVVRPGVNDLAACMRVSRALLQALGSVVEDPKTQQDHSLQVMSPSICAILPFFDAPFSPALTHLPYIGHHIIYPMIC